MRARLWLLLSLCWAGSVSAAEATTAPEAQLRLQALALISRDDAQSAISYISGRDPQQAMALFILVTRDLYWQNRNLTVALVIGRAGIQFGLLEADRVSGETPDIATELRTQARVLAYDLSSYCWPGWDEAGIEIPAVYLAHGQDLAKINLRLARELQLGDLPRSKAWWLLGAHHLAAKQYERARRAFVEGTKYATAAGERDYELLLRGYVYLSDILKQPENFRLREELGYVRAQLAELDNGVFFSDQLDTALDVFSQTGTK